MVYDACLASSRPRVPSPVGASVFSRTRSKLDVTTLDVMKMTSDVVTTSNKKQKTIKASSANKMHLSEPKNLLILRVVFLPWVGFEPPPVAVDWSAILFLSGNMAPKRKASTTPRQSTKRKATSTDPETVSKEDLVAAVVQQLTPVIHEAVKQALPPPTLQPADAEDDDSFSAVMGDAAVTPGEGATPHPICAHVPDKLLNSIRAGYYVNFNELLSVTEVQDVSLSILSSGKVELRNKSKFTAISTLDQWCQAFLVFASVYGESFPHCQTALFRYMSSVLTIARNFSIEAAVKYDADFRQLKSKSPTLPWDVIHQELYLLAASKVAVPKKQLFRAPTTNPCPPGYCFRFNSTGNCSRSMCPFKHQCFRCQGPHGAKYCNPKQLSKPKNNNGVANPNQST